MNFIKVLFILLLSGCQSSKPKINITYQQDIKPIIERSCLSCHGPGKAVTYYPLDTFEFLKKNAQIISKWVRDKKMPPYNYTSDGIEYNNPEFLNDKERNILLEFLKSPIMGKTTQEKKVMIKDQDDPTISTTIIKFGKGVKVSPRKFLYKCFFVDIPDELEGQYITDFIYDFQRVKYLHHVFAHLVDISTKEEFNKTLNKKIGCMYPKVNYLRGFGRGVGYKIKKGQNLLFRTHYDRTMDESLDDKGTSGDFKITIKTEPTTEYSPMTVRIFMPFKDIAIPYGEVKSFHKSISVKKLMSFAKDAKELMDNLNGANLALFSIGFHMHSLGRIAKLSVVSGGKERVIIQEDEYDYTHRFHATPTKPIKLNLDDVLKMTCGYDNTEMNPRNILFDLENKEVVGGLSGTDEMCLVTLGVIKLEKDQESF